MTARMLDIPCEVYDNIHKYGVKYKLSYYSVNEKWEAILIVKVDEIYNLIECIQIKVLRHDYYVFHYYSGENDIRAYLLYNYTAEEYAEYFSKDDKGIKDYEPYIFINKVLSIIHQQIVISDGYLDQWRRRIKFKEFLDNQHDLIDSIFEETKQVMPNTNPLMMIKQQVYHTCENELTTIILIYEHKGIVEYLRISSNEINQSCFDYSNIQTISELKIVYEDYYKIINGEDTIIKLTPLNNEMSDLYDKVINLIQRGFGRGRYDNNLNAEQDIIVDNIFKEVREQKFHTKSAKLK